VAFGIRTTLLPNLGRLVRYRAFIGRVAVEHPAAAIVTVAALMGLVVLISLVLRRTVRRLAWDFLQGLRVLAAPRFYLTRVVPLQILNWVVQLTALGFFLAAFGLPATPRTVLVAQAAKSLAILIPFTPSGAGAQFALLMLAFGRRFEPLAVSGFAVGMRLATMLFNVAVGGMAIVLMLGMSRRRRMPAPAIQLVQRVPARILAARAATSARDLPRVNDRE
jgi:uncharacterized membrane protein YbhN (UPF0104 family)